MNYCAIKIILIKGHFLLNILCMFFQEIVERDGNPEEILVDNSSVRSRLIV